MNVLTKTAKQACPGELVAVNVGGRLETNDIRFNTAFTHQQSMWEVRGGWNGWFWMQSKTKKWTDIHISQIMRKKIQEDKLATHP